MSFVLIEDEFVMKRYYLQAGNNENCLQFKKSKYLCLNSLSIFNCYGTNSY